MDAEQELLSMMSNDILSEAYKETLKDLDLEESVIDILTKDLIRKMENGSTFEQALKTIYGVDLMPDNVKLCQDRLLCGREDLRHIVEKNIVCADALRYHYRFDGSDPYETENDKVFNSLFV